MDFILPIHTIPDTCAKTDTTTKAMVEPDAVIVTADKKSTEESRLVTDEADGGKPEKPPLTADNDKAQSLDKSEKHEETTDQNH